MLKLLGAFEESPRLIKRIAFMKMGRDETEILRARDLISRALGTSRRNIVGLKSFAVHDKVWFHRIRHG